jgi:hypothetical protein
MNQHWTTNPPSEQGYYWFQVKDVAQIVKVVLRTSGLCIEYGQFFIPLAHYDGVGAEWCGPIPVPSRITATEQGSGQEVILLESKDRLERFQIVNKGTAVFITDRGIIFGDCGERSKNGVRIFNERY